MENIPDHFSFHGDSRPHLPLSAGFHTLLDQAKYSVEVVSAVWDLNARDVEAKQVHTGPGVLTLSPAHYISQVSRQRTCNYFRSGFARALLMRSTLPRCLPPPPPTPTALKKLELLLLHSDAEPFSLHQGQLLFQRLLRLASRGVKLKIVSGLTNSAELRTLAEHGERLVASRVHGSDA